MIFVRKAERADAPTLLGLIDALADFEKLERPSEEARARLTRDGWPEDGASPRYTAWLAELEIYDGKPRQAVGYAITFPTYSTFLARPTLYLEDLFILPDSRRLGAGIALMQHLKQEAEASGCGRMEWVCLDWNTNAQSFYRRLGASHLEEWQFFRLELNAD